MRMRQRLRTRTSAFALIGRILVFVLACALVFYGAVLVLLALKVSPGTLDDVSGYRSAYEELAGVDEGDIGDTLRIIAAAGGLLAFLVFGSLAVKQLPRPYLARHDLELTGHERGRVTVEPRAIERVAEGASLDHAAVTGAAGRYGDDELAVGVTLRDPEDASRTLTDVQAAIAAALERHGLPAMPVNLTLTGYERQTQRELT